MYNPFTIEKQLKDAKQHIKAQKDYADWMKAEYDNDKLLKAGWTPIGRPSGNCPQILWKPPKKFQETLPHEYSTKTAHMFLWTGIKK